MEYMQRKHHLKRYAVSMAVLFVCSACSTSSVVPRSDYDTLDRDDSARYKIVALDGTVYIVSGVTVIGDAIVGHDAEGPDGHEGDVTIPMNQVESVHRLTATGHAMAFVSGLLVGGLLTAVGYVVMMTAVGWGY